MATILYVGTDAGVVTVKGDEGQSWKVENHALKDWAVSEVAVSSSHPNHVYAGTRGDGVWLSEDYGKSWTKPCRGKPGPGKVRCVTLDPDNSETLYAGTEPIDLFMSEDGGKSWSRIDSVREVPWVESVDYPVASVEPHVRDITIDPKDRRKIYIALQVGYILKSTDGGQHWQLLDHDLDADVHTILVHPIETQKIFIATGGHDCRKGKAKGRALYKSEDEGENWKPMALDFTEEYSLPLVMHPKDPAILYSAVAKGQPGQWRRRDSGAESFLIQSKDSGLNWQKLNGSDPEIASAFPEAIVIDENDPDNMFIALRSGHLYSSSNGGNSWGSLDVNVGPLSDMKIVHA